MGLRAASASPGLRALLGAWPGLRFGAQGRDLEPLRVTAEALEEQLGKMRRQHEEAELKSQKRIAGSQDGAACSCS